MGAALPLGFPEVTLYPDLDELRALRFVYENTGPEDSVYIGLQDHSSIFVPDVRAYWMLGRPIGVRHHVLEPGLASDHDIQQMMISDLQEKEVSWIVLWQGIKGGVTAGSRSLDRYIGMTYEPVRAFGDYTVYRARPPASPAGANAK
jgi:hypothetical protein